MADLLNVTDAARLLGVNHKTLYRQLKTRGGTLNGIVFAIQINHRWRCLPDAIERIRRGERSDELDAA